MEIIKAGGVIRDVKMKGNDEKEIGEIPIARPGQSILRTGKSRRLINPESGAPFF